MAEKSEGLVLSEVFEDVRSLTKFYLALAKDVDPYRRYEAHEHPLNSLYWIMGHLVWSEHYLLVEAMTGEKLNIPWLEKFERGSDSEEAQGPSIGEISDTMELIHKHAMSNLAAMSDAALDAPNLAGIQFRGGDAKRVIVRHAIRHEPCHAGQIGWILKMNGLESV